MTHLPRGQQEQARRGVVLVHEQAGRRSAVRQLGLQPEADPGLGAQVLRSGNRQLAVPGQCWQGALQG